MEVNVIAILLAFLVNMLKRYSATLSTLVNMLVHRSSSRQQQKQAEEIAAEMREATSERDAHSPIDEFAKYALADRKLSKLGERLKETRARDASARMRTLVYIKAALMALVSFGSIGLIWSFYDQPVIRFSEADDSDDIFYPLGGLVAFPCTSVANSIGVTLWLVVTNRLIDICANKCSPTTTSPRLLA